MPAPAGPPPAPTTGAWATLPPIQRTVGAAPLVAPSRPFLAHVPGHNPLPPIVEPLGHETGPGAPPGLLIGHARAVASLTSSAPLPARPVQRHAVPDHGQPGGSPWASVASTAGDDASTAGDGMPSGSDGRPASGLPPVAPVRTLATIPAPATVRPAARPLTQAPPLAPSIQRSARDASPPATGLHAATGRRTPASPAGPGRGSEPSIAASGSALPLQRVTPGWSEGRSRWSEGSAPDPSPAEAGSTTRVPSPARGAIPPGVPARRPGLGAPISLPPATAVTQRLPMRTAGAHQSASTASPASPGRPSPGSQPATSISGPGPEPAAPPQPWRPLPALPVVRQRSGEPAPPAERSSGPNRPAPPGGPATTGDAHAHPASVHPASVPTLGARPLRPASVTAQRLANPARSEPAAARPVPVPARWTSHDELPATITAQRRRDDAAMVPAPVRLGSAGTGAPGAIAAAFPTGPSDAGPDVPREIVFPPRDTPPGDAAAPAGRPATEVQRLAGPVAMDPRSGSVAAPLTLARPGPAQGATTGPGPSWTTPASGSAGSSNGAAAGTVGGSAGAPVVQATRIETGPGLPAFTATPVVQRVDGSAPGPTADADERSDAELDELAGALFGRIRTHLRSEVIHEREARGLTFDAF